MTLQFSSINKYKETETGHTQEQNRKAGKLRDRIRLMESSQWSSLKALI
jgi:hypothetical protein